MAKNTIELQVIEGMLSKECKECGEIKPLEEYHKDKRGLGGRYSKCKQCKKKYRKNYYSKNQEKEIQNRRNYVRVNYQKVLESKRKNRIRGLK
ncbi:hypothetical protein ACTWQB_15650 [Piscibacillus sp. B03]|uniref:hypothetical protein n=1 Tax=Piscibacillus sp. B03 TaxID=3457430 RepID=UPI003FCD0621